MTIAEQFESFAADFEVCVGDDNWSRLEEYFTESATYQNIGGQDPVIKGPKAILEYFRNNVAETDRRFDSRELVALTTPAVFDDRLSRRWRCTYQLHGTPNLVVEGEARYSFEGNLIASMEEELTPESMEQYVRWMNEYGPRLQA